MAKRLVAMGNSRYVNNFKVTLHQDLVDLPYKWAKPRKVFVNSMSDLFHQEVPLDFIQKVFNTMNDTPRYTYQILTKRPSRLAELAPYLNLEPNIWIGVSVENEAVLNRIDYLKEVLATVHFLSCEPLLGSLNNMNLAGIHWGIVSRKSGPGARPIEEEWIWDIKLNCGRNSIPFFFKQWGGVQKHLTRRF